jgi:hypothetical protein
MTIWDNLLAECQRLEDLTRKIQEGENTGLSREEIEHLSHEYQVWFSKCLSVLPDDLKSKFRSEYEGSFWSAKIKKFFEASTERSVFRPTDQTTKELFPYWAYPFKQNFYPHIQSQRQLLIEARERPNNAESHETVTEEDAWNKSAKALDEELAKAHIDIQAIGNEDRLIQEVLRPIFEFLSFKGITVLHHSGTIEHGKDIVFYQEDNLDCFLFYAVVACNTKIHTDSSRTRDSGHYDKILDQVKKCYSERWRDNNLKRDAYIDKVIITTSSTITDSAIAYFRSWEEKERRQLIFLDGNRLAGFLARLRLSR